MTAIIRLQKKFGKLNHTRDTVPPELESIGVPLSLWSNTVDGFLGWHLWNSKGNVTYNRSSSGGGGILIVVGIALCILGLIVRDQLCILLGVAVSCASCCCGPGATRELGGDGRLQAIDVFVENQQEAYAPFNIKVSREGPERFPVLVLETDANACQPCHHEASSTSMTQELQTLVSLQQSGALTMEEFTRAKERVIIGQAELPI